MHAYTYLNTGIPQNLMLQDNNGKKLTYLNVGTNSEISIKKLSDIISKKQIIKDNKMG